MLIEFKVTNYRSIRAEQTLSMVASNYSDELPQNLISCDHVPGMKGVKLVKAVALYGANASGKSNIVAALRFFAEFVRDSATKLQLGAPTGTQPFKLDPACLTEPSKFEITAVINGIRTLYGIEMTRERVTSEYLVVYPKGRPQVWFERDWDEKTLKYEWSKSTELKWRNEARRQDLAEHVAYAGRAAINGNLESGTVWRIANAIKTLALGPGELPFGYAMRALKEPQTRQWMQNALLAADMGFSQVGTHTVESFELEKLWEWLGNAHSVVRDGNVFKNDEESLSTLKRDQEIPLFFHKGKSGTAVTLDFFAEQSAGTKQFFRLLGRFAAALKSRWTLVLDELDASLHPHLVKTLLAAFATANDQGAQLIFTTHNPLLLDQTLLRRDQIWFTEKDQEGATRLYPLTDFKPRKDESLVKGYLTGRYGGIPFIPEGLKF